MAWDSMQAQRWPTEINQLVIRPPPPHTHAPPTHPPTLCTLQAKQEPGEFIVLNAAAYHSVYNLGFNCAGAWVGWGGVGVRG